MSAHPLRVSPGDWNLMRAHVVACLPEEACGLLGGRAGEIRMVLPVLNALGSASRFRMDPEGQLAAMGRIEQEGEEIIGIYHSHPSGPPHPSGTDLAEDSYPDAAQLIWFPTAQGWDCAAFWLEAGNFVPVAIRRSRDETYPGRRGF